MHFSEQILQTLSSQGNAPAFEVEGGWFAWSQVAAIAERIDELLREAGVGPGRAVGLIGRNRPAPSSAMLGILATRRCVAPINPFQAVDRLVNDIVQLDLAAVIGEAEDFVDGELAKAAKSCGFAAIVLNGERPQDITLVHGNTRGEQRETGETALLLSTSGTTGVPKRIALRFDSLAASMRDSQSASIEFGELDLPGPVQTPLIQHSPLVHISGTLSVTRAGFDARRLVMLKKFDPAAWVDVVRRHRPRAVSLPPTMMRMVVNENPAPEDLSSLIGVYSGASPVDMNVFRFFENRYGSVVIGNYGATEYCGMVAWGSLDDRARYGHAKDHAAGRFRPNISHARVIDPETGRVLAPGEVGVLEVQVARIGPEWMRTSDLASLDEENFLYFEGRADDAINRGGFKVVPTIIADALRRHPSVGEVAVVGLVHDRLGEVPVAAIELKTGMSVPEMGELMAFAKGQLVAYQVPVEIRVVESLPRTPSFKIDRTAVKALFAGTH